MSYLSLSSIDKFALSLGMNPMAIGGIVESQFDQNWTQKYLEGEYFKQDPIALIGSSLNKNSFHILSQQQMVGAVYEEARLHGAASSMVVVSFFGGNKMIMGAVCDSGIDHKEGERILLNARKLHRQKLLLGIEALNDRQFSILDGASSGDCSKVISANLGISVVAVNNHKKKICDILQVSTFHSAVELYSIFLFKGLGV